MSASKIAGSGAAAASPEQCDVTIYRAGTGAVQTFTLRSGGVLRIGRGVANDVVLDFNGVSVYHAELYLRPAGPGDPGLPGSQLLCVRDESKNGVGVRPGPHSHEYAKGDYGGKGGVPPWETLKKGQLRVLEHGFQLIVPQRSRKENSQLAEACRVLTVYLGTKIGPAPGDEEIDGEAWEPTLPLELKGAVGARRRGVAPAPQRQIGLPGQPPPPPDLEGGAFEEAPPPPPGGEAPPLPDRPLLVQSTVVKSVGASSAVEEHLIARDQWVARAREGPVRRKEERERIFWAPTAPAEGPPVSLAKAAAARDPSDEKEEESGAEDKEKDRKREKKREKKERKEGQKARVLEAAREEERAERRRREKKDKKKNKKQDRGRDSSREREEEEEERERRRKADEDAERQDRKRDKKEKKTRKREEKARAAEESRVHETERSIAKDEEIEALKDREAKEREDKAIEARDREARERVAYLLKRDQGLDAAGGAERKKKLEKEQWDRRKKEREERERLERELEDEIAEELVRKERTKKKDGDGKSTAGDANQNMDVDLAEGAGAAVAVQDEAAPAGPVSAQDEAEAPAGAAAFSTEPAEAAAAAEAAAPAEAAANLAQPATDEADTIKQVPASSALLAVSGTEVSEAQVAESAPTSPPSAAPLQAAGALPEVAVAGAGAGGRDGEGSEHGTIVPDDLDAEAEAEAPPQAAEETSAAPTTGGDGAAVPTEAPSAPAPSSPTEAVEEDGGAAVPTEAADDKADDAAAATALTALARDLPVVGQAPAAAVTARDGDGTSAAAERPPPTEDRDTSVAPDVAPTSPAARSGAEGLLESHAAPTSPAAKSGAEGLTGAEAAPTSPALPEKTSPAPDRDRPTSPARSGVSLPSRPSVAREATPQAVPKAGATAEAAQGGLTAAALAAHSRALPPIGGDTATSMHAEGKSVTGRSIAASAIAPSAVAPSVVAPTVRTFLTHGTREQSQTVVPGRAGGLTAGLLGAHNQEVPPIGAGAANTFGRSTAGKSAAATERTFRTHMTTRELVVGASVMRELMRSVSPISTPGVNVKKKRRRHSPPNRGAPSEVTRGRDADVLSTAATRGPSPSPTVSPATARKRRKKEKKLRKEGRKEVGEGAGAAPKEKKRKAREARGDATPRLVSESHWRANSPTPFSRGVVEPSVTPLYKDKEESEVAPSHWSGCDKEGSVPQYDSVSVTSSRWGRKRPGTDAGAARVVLAETSDGEGLVAAAVASTDGTQPKKKKKRRELEETADAAVGKEAKAGRKKTRKRSP